MAPCPNCGAVVAPDLTACPYCHAPTAAAERVHEEEEQAHLRKEREEIEARAKIAVEVAAASKRALLWSIAGAFLCFFVFPQLVGVALALRARSLARKAGVLPPTNSTIALVISGIESVAMIAFYIWVIVNEVNLAGRKKELRAELVHPAEAVALSQSTACGLAELHLLEVGFGTASPSAVHEFDCPGKLVQHGDLATLDDVRFRENSERRQRQLTVCLKRGARWTVEGFRSGAGASCEGPDPEPGASGASTGKRDKH